MKYGTTKQQIFKQGTLNSKLKNYKNQLTQQGTQKIENITVN